MLSKQGARSQGCLLHLLFPSVCVGEPSEEDEEAEQAPEQQQQQQQQPGPSGPPAVPQASAAAAAATAAAAAAGSAVVTAWQPGHVSAVTDGAAELQQLLNSIEDATHSTTNASAAPAAAAAEGPHFVVIEWVAPWAAASLAASQQLQGLAATCCQLPVITVDATASGPNRALALEKVMEVPQVYRKGGRKFLPVPKSGEQGGGCKGGGVPVARGAGSEIRCQGWQCRGVVQG